MNEQVKRNLNRFPPGFMFSLRELERKVAGHDQAIRSLIQAIRELMAPPEKTGRAIRFQVEEPRPVYRRSRRGRAR